MKKLEDEEKKEYLERKERERLIVEYQKLQIEEKKKLAKNDFINFNEDGYKTKMKLQQENDEFLKYAENWIKDYKNQGKNINPLLLELKKYKKNNKFS